MAVAKRKATRAARHTMGHVQKKGVRGAVKVTVTTTPLDQTEPRGRARGAERPNAERQHNAALVSHALA
ncbi:MAG TPA: hypothetical protein VGY54_02420 [Polyangiaceae bacterium]|nr:hypothetical protein [Polyangiaceae bacterium]